MVNLCLSTDKKFSVKKYSLHAGTYFQKSMDQNHINCFTSPYANFKLANTGNFDSLKKQ